MGTILIILDGLAGRPPNTGLMMSRHPNMNRLAEEGMCGLMLTLGKGRVPESEDGHLQLFGYEPSRYLKGRGPLEALGAGIVIRRGDIAFRTNLGTAKAVTRKSNIGKRRLMIIDRRAGRIATNEAKRFERIIKLACKHIAANVPGCKIIYKQTVEHRGVLILRGKGLSSHITGTDPRKTGVAIKRSSAKNSDKASERTANIVNMFTEEVFDTLDNHPINIERANRGKPKANIVLLRGPGRYTPIPSIKKRFGMRAAAVAGGALYKGVAKYVGMDIIEVSGATGDKNTDIRAKIDTALALLENKHQKRRRGAERQVTKSKHKEQMPRKKRYDLVFLHIKATDSFSHDRNCKGKARFIEKIDKHLGKLIRTKHTVILTGDHATPCIIGEHTADPIPVLIRSRFIEPDSVDVFDETHCKRGRLGLIHGREIMPLIIELNR